MIDFASLSPVLRAFFALWVYLLCLAGIVGALFSITKKRYLFAALSLLILAPAYVMWQVTFDLTLAARTGIASALSLALVALPWLVWFVASIVLTGAVALILAYDIRYAKHYITPSAIKSFLDGIPCGVCCWRDNGRVLFSNMCMDSLCVALLEEPPRNGNSFRDAVADEILSIEDKMWRFTCREIQFGGERMHEMIASDITAEYAKTQALEKDKAELSRLKSELEAYTKSIDETVRRQELLQAKVNIHDEMNRLMLSTVAAESGDAATMDGIFALWEQNALLLCLAAEEIADRKAKTRIEQLAAALKIRLVWPGNLPAALTEAQRGLFFSAAQEAIANAAKHADAREMSISFDVAETHVDCRIVNDGKTPCGEVPFIGGLANLSHLAGLQGATVSVETGDVFTLKVSFPVGNTTKG